MGRCSRYVNYLLLFLIFCLDITRIDTKMFTVIITGIRFIVIIAFKKYSFTSTFLVQTYSSYNRNMNF